jgi:hypothetical protein
MSKWNHSICEECWKVRYNGNPVRVTEREVEKCCFCGLKQAHGIYVRADPKSCLCGGVHDDETS